MSEVVARTLVLLDVEGSTRRWEADADAAGADMAALDAVVEAVARRHGGAVVRERGEGDSHFLVFDGPAAGAACAAELQQRFHDEPWRGGPMRVRAALHHGRVEIREGGYYGRGVNRCARLRALADGGQVLLTDEAAQLLVADPPAGTSLVDHGLHALKDLDAPHRVWELRIAGLPAAPAPRSARAHNLPAPPTPLRGRAALVHAVADHLDGGPEGGRLLTLVGTGGIGKTRLALEVGRALLPSTPDGVWVVELATVQNPEVLPVAVATAMGLRTPPGRTTRSLLREVLPPLAAVVILDNCEHLLADCADLAADLLAGGGPLRLLATSRQPLGIPGEHRVAVPPLSLTPDPGQPRSPAVQLFVDRVTAARGALDATDPAVASAAEQVVAAVDGLPLAIELAAARSAHLALDDLVDRIDQQAALLADRGRDGRHGTIRAAVEWSHRLLPVDEQRLLRRLSVLPGSFPLAAAEVLGTAAEPPVADVLDALSGLVDRSLVVADVGGATSRYRLLQPIRAVAAEHLADAAEEPACTRALLGWFGPLVAGQPTAVARLAPEIDIARRLLDADPPPDPAAVLQLAADLVEVWGQVLPTEGEARLAQLLEARPAQDRARVAALNALGELRKEHDVPGATEQFEAALALADALGDAPGLLRARLGLATTAVLAFEHERAVPVFESVIADAEVAGDVGIAAAASKGLAHAVGQRGDIARSEALMRRAIALREEAGHAGHAAVAELGLCSIVLLQRGRFEEAVPRLTAVLAALDAEGYRAEAHVASFNLARAMAGAGDLAGARAQLAATRERALALGNQTTLAWVAAQTGEIARQQGLLDDAEAAYAESLERFDRIGNNANRLYLRSNLAHIGLSRGAWEEAEQVGLEILAAAVAVGDADAVAEFLELVAEARIGAGAARDDAGQVADGLALLAAAEAEREVLGMPREPADQGDHDAAMARVRRVLPGEAAAAAVAAGRARPFADVVGEVLDRRDSQPRLVG